MAQKYVSNGWQETELHFDSQFIKYVKIICSTISQSNWHNTTWCTMQWWRVLSWYTDFSLEKWHYLWLCVIPNTKCDVRICHPGCIYLLSLNSQIHTQWCKNGEYSCKQSQLQNRILDKCGQNSFDLLFLKKILPLIWAVQDLATFPKFASWTHTNFFFDSILQC